MDAGIKENIHALLYILEFRNLQKYEFQNIHNQNAFFGFRCVYSVCIFL